MDTLLLNPKTWDLVPDAAGNIALAANPYALAQDAASAIKLFKGEYWYDISLGIPYWGQILGQQPPIQLVKSQSIKAALTVPDVVAAQCFIKSVDNRQVSGQVQVTDVQGRIAIAGFAR